MPTVTNITGTNAGPASGGAPLSMMPVGNGWKLGVFTQVLALGTVATVTCTEQTFTFTGLLTTDIVFVTSTAAPVAGLIIGNSRCKSADVLAISTGNPTAGTITPVTTDTWTITVIRPLPNYSQASSGTFLNW
jgi:hypothetical protein